jgi:hypothetical protein
LTLGIFSLYSGDIPLNEEVVLTEREEFMNASVLPVAVESTAVSTSEGDQEVVQVAFLTVLARCEIAVGMECSVSFLDHDDPESWSFCVNCHGERAVVIALNPMEKEVSVDIRMVSGKATDRVYRGLNSRILVFDGPFALMKCVS